MRPWKPNSLGARTSRPSKIFPGGRSFQAHYLIGVFCHRQHGGGGADLTERADEIIGVFATAEASQDGELVADLGVDYRAGEIHPGRVGLCDMELRA